MDALQTLGLSVAFMTGMMVSNSVTDGQRAFVIVIILAVIIALLMNLANGQSGRFGRW